MKHIRHTARYLFIVAIGWMTFSCQTPTSESVAEQLEEQPPNIVFILSDDQSYTDYSFMGHEHIQTPNIDQMASEALTFTRGYVPTSLCSPSLASIITGVYPRQHGILGNDWEYNRTEDRKQRMQNRAKAYAPVIEQFKEQVTLPEMLREKGYLSFQSGKWWLGSYKAGGFDYGMTHGNPNRGGRHGDYGLDIGRKGMDTLNNFIDLAVEKEKPFFVWYAPFLPHAPHTPPDSLLQKYLPVAPSEYVAKYWAMCEWFDLTIGQLTDYIEQKGLIENTLFVYVCDNGWVQNLDDPSYNRNSKRSPYDYGMRTPIFYKWKGKIEPKMDKVTLTSSIDMVPTVLDLLDIGRPDYLPGVNVLDEEELNARDAIYGEIYAHDFTTVDSSLFYRIVYTNPYKLIWPDEERKSSESIQLYNIYEDPTEQHDLAEAKPQVVQSLKDKIEKHWKN